MRSELSAIASVQAHWLSMRQEAVASNVANASLPGYRARVAPTFSAVVGGMGAGARPDPTQAIMPSQNTVDLASAMIEGAEVGRMHRINSAVTGAFHRMMTMAAQ